MIPAPHRLLTGLALTALLVGWLATGPAQADQQARTFSARISQSVRLDYLLFMPAGATREPTRRWPLILFLHGAGERGDDLAKVKLHGPSQWIESHPEFPFIVVSPQVPAGGDWHIDSLDALLEELLTSLPVDPQRVYLTGLSMGGHATWNWASQRPQRFAAIAPVCGWGKRFQACTLKTVPIWAFHGDQDPVVPFSEDQALVQAVNACGGSARLTTYVGGGHDAWTDTYANPQLYNWLLSHTR